MSLSSQERLTVHMFTPAIEAGAPSILGSSDIKTEIERLGVDFILLERRKQPILAKILKESGRLFLFPVKNLKKKYLFFLEQYFRIWPSAKRIIEVIEKLKIDLLYMNNQPSSNLEGIMAARIVKIPCIQHSRIGAGLNRVEVNAVNNWLTKMLCVSQGVKEMFVAQGVDAGKCEVVYNGIDPNVKPAVAASEVRSRWGIKDNEIIIGTVGSLIKRKRVNDLIGVLTELRQEGKFLKCMIVGDGPEKDNLQKEVLKVGLQDKVIFTGFQTDAISYANAMDIFALSSENEGLPRVILEAMLMAKPVVACDVTGSSELVIDGKTGFLVPARNSKALAAAVSKLIASSELRSRMGEKGRELAIEKFSIEKYIDGVNNVFKEVLG